MLLCIYFLEAEEIEPKKFKGIFLSCISAFGRELVNFSCLEKLNLTGATSCPVTWEHCVRATRFSSPFCFLPALLLQLPCTFLSPIPHSWVTVDLFQSVVVIIKDLLCVSKRLFSFFIVSLLKCFYWKTVSVFFISRRQCHQDLKWWNGARSRHRP